MTMQRSAIKTVLMLLAERADRLGKTPGNLVDEMVDKAFVEFDQLNEKWEHGFILWLEGKLAWSYKTFGMAERAEGVCKHIEAELVEVRADPYDIKEWIDVVLLALDGACRTGHTPREIVETLVEKQKANELRKWAPPPLNDQPSFHIKEEK